MYAPTTTKKEFVMDFATIYLTANAICHDCKHICYKMHFMQYLAISRIVGESTFSHLLPADATPAGDCVNFWADHPHQEFLKYFMGFMEECLNIPMSLSVQNAHKIDRTFCPTCRED